MKTWVEKYRPKLLHEVVGNPRAVKALQDWVEVWKKGIPEKRAILLYGGAGNGKTSSAYAIVKELNYDYIELNASDSRTYDVINRIVGSASSSGTIDPEQGRKVIIIDELDGVHGKSDYGGLKAIKKCIKESLQPIILIANDPWALSKDFRALCTMVEFKRIDQRTILKTLKGICTKEGISTEEKVLKIIATNANGDLRSAINDLQALSEGSERLEIGDTEILGMRDTETKIFGTVARILKTTSCDRAREAVWNTNEDPDTIFKWIVENVPLEYEDSGDLARAFDCLSRADVFMGRIIRRQDWSLQSYAIDMMSAGVATAKKMRYHKFTRYQYPKIFVLYARTKKDRGLIDEISKKISQRCHVSKKVAKKEFFPPLKILLNAKDIGPAIASELNLTLEEIEFFIKDKRAAKDLYQTSEKMSAEKLRERTKEGYGKQISLAEFSN